MSRRHNACPWPDRRKSSISAYYCPTDDLSDIVSVGAVVAVAVAAGVVVVAFAVVAVVAVAAVLELDMMLAAGRSIFACYHYYCHHYYYYYTIVPGCWQHYCWRRRRWCCLCGFLFRSNRTDGRLSSCVRCFVAAVAGGARDLQLACGRPLLCGSLLLLPPLPSLSLAALGLLAACSWLQAKNLLLLLLRLLRLLLSRLLGAVDELGQARSLASHSLALFYCASNSLKILSLLSARAGPLALAPVAATLAFN